MVMTSSSFPDSLGLIAAVVVVVLVLILLPSTGPMQKEELFAKWENNKQTSNVKLLFMFMFVFVPYGRRVVGDKMTIDMQIVTILIFLLLFFLSSSFFILFATCLFVTHLFTP